MRGKQCVLSQAEENNYNFNRDSAAKRSSNDHHTDHKLFRVQIDYQIHY